MSPARNCAALLALALMYAPATWAARVDDTFAAIRANDLTKLDALTKDRASVNEKDGRGITPLMIAAVTGSPAAMKMLVDRGADVNAKNAFDSTALMWSVTDLEKVRLLVDHGADVNVASKQGNTALLLAAMSDRSASIVKLLIAKGADVKAVNGGKINALIAATQGGDFETVRIFVDAGIDVNAAMIVGFAPLMNAAGTGNLAAVKLLLSKGANVNAVSAPQFEEVKNGPIQLGKFTALINAATVGNPELVKILLDAGADINAREVRGMTPLMLAIATDHQHPDTISALLAKKPDLNAKDKYGETALDWAKKSGDRFAIDALKRAGAADSPGKAAIALPAPAPVELKPAVERGIALLEKSNASFFANGGCSACHNHNITDIAVGVARTRGVHFDANAAAERQKLNKAFFGAGGPAFLERADTPGSPDVPTYALAAMAASGMPPDRMTDFLLANVIAQQFSDGHFHLNGARPPVEDADIARTALAVRGMAVYGSPGRAAEMKERIGRAKNWLASVKPVTAEDRNMRLMGLSWAGDSAKSLQGHANAILDLQRPDGGWSQRAEMASDAYATGETMFALAQAAGVSAKDSSYQRAVTFLLARQRADGSWYVASRSPKFQPYFESGFPYGHDQWISSMATGWSTAALALALEPAAAKGKVGGE
jgi:ankyrin repeat protein